MCLGAYEDDSGQPLHDLVHCIGKIGGKWMHQDYLYVDEELCICGVCETSFDRAYYCIKQKEKHITTYNFFCNDIVFHCDTTDSIINIMYHLPLMLCGNWTTSHT